MNVYIIVLDKKGIFEISFFVYWLFKQKKMSIENLIESGAEKVCNQCNNLITQVKGSHLK